MTVDNSGTIAANGGSITVEDISEDTDNGITVTAPSLQNTGTITANDGAVTIDTSVSGMGGTLLLQNGTMHLGEALGTADDPNTDNVDITGDDYGSIASGQTIAFEDTDDTLDILGLFSNPQDSDPANSQPEMLASKRGPPHYGIGKLYSWALAVVDHDVADGDTRIARTGPDGA